MRYRGLGFDALRLMAMLPMLWLGTAIAPGQTMPPVIHLGTPHTPVLPPSPAAILECDRAIYVLRLGAAQRWTNRDQYLSAFEAMTATGTNGEPLTQARSALIRFLEGHLRIHESLDEGPPIEVEVSRAISELAKDRDAMMTGEMAKKQ